MLGGYLEFLMKPELAGMYLTLKSELEELIQKKLLDPKLDLDTYSDLLTATQTLVSQDQSEGRFVFGRKLPGAPKKTLIGGDSLNWNPKLATGVNGGNNAKNQLQTLLARGGHSNGKYTTIPMKFNQFRSTVVFSGMSFTGEPCGSKKDAEKSAAT